MSIVYLFRFFIAKKIQKIQIEKGLEYQLNYKKKYYFDKLRVYRLSFVKIEKKGDKRIIRLKIITNILILIIYFITTVRYKLNYVL